MSRRRQEAAPRSVLLWEAADHLWMEGVRRRLGMTDDPAWLRTARRKVQRALTPAELALVEAAVAGDPVDLGPVPPAGTRSQIVGGLVWRHDVWQPHLEDFGAEVVPLRRVERPCRKE